VDFIEVLFDISPDDGSGTLEVMILGALCAILITLDLSIVFGRFRRPLRKASNRRLE
jgi:hypothetical protein